MGKIEDEIGNPVRHYYATNGRNRKRRVIDFSELDEWRNPIPLEIKDPEEVKKTFKYFIPYSFVNEFSADRFLSWLINVAKLSPTHGSVKNKKLRYAFGGDIIFEKFDAGGFAIGDKEDVSEETQRAAAKELIDLGFTGDRLRTLAQKLADNYLDTGTGWLEVVRGNVLGERVAEVHWHDVRFVRFWHEIRDGVKYVGISKRWDFQAVKHSPPKLIPEYPNWTEKDGVQRTFIQVKNGTNFWYGRPSWIQALYPVYNEMKDSEYLIKASDSNFISKAIIEAEEGDGDVLPFIDDEGAQELGYDNFQDQMNQEHTAKGDDPSSFIFTERPAGALPMKVFELKPNSNEDYFEKVGKLLRTRIMEAHDWNSYLMGEDTATGFADSAHLQNLKIAEGTVLKDLRKDVWDPINLALREILTFHGVGDVETQVNSQNPLQYMIEMLEEAGEDTDDLKRMPGQENNEEGGDNE